MVRIKNLEEYQRIKEADFGFLVIPNSKSVMRIHEASCDILGADDYIKQREDMPDSIELHWFSTISLAEKFSDLESCKTCKPK